MYRFSGLAVLQFCGFVVLWFCGLFPLLNLLSFLFFITAEKSNDRKKRYVFDRHADRLSFGRNNSDYLSRARGGFGKGFRRNDSRRHACALQVSPGRKFVCSFKVFVRL